MMILHDFGLLNLQVELHWTIDGNQLQTHLATLKDNPHPYFLVKFQFIRQYSCTYDNILITRCNN